jgi:hypothetical protein
MGTQILEKWDNIKTQYPDSFVLLENPDFDGAILRSAIFRYKNKSRKKVFEKARGLDLDHITIQYTGGVRMDKLKDVAFVL